MKQGITWGWGNGMYPPRPGFLLSLDFQARGHPDILLPTQMNATTTLSLCLPVLTLLLDLNPFCYIWEEMVAFSPGKDTARAVQELVGGRGTDQLCCPVKQCSLSNSPAR